MKEGKVLKMAGDRVSVKDDGTLSIKKTISADSGFYTCLIHDSNGAKSSPSLRLMVFGG